jgi:TolB protein
VSRRLLVAVTLVLAVGAPAAHATTAGIPGRIVFTSTRDYPNAELYSANPDGSDVRRLTTSPYGGVAQSPSVSPDGSRIAFQTFSTGNNRAVLAFVNADGTGYSVPFDSGSQPWDDRAPSWSPDGQWIAFASTRPFNEAYHVWVMHPDGTGLRQVTQGWGYAPDWSPDGTKLVYSGLGDNGNNAVWMVNLDGSNEHRVTSSAFSEDDPAWSPDGTQIAFARYTTDFRVSNEHSLYLVNADGTNDHRVTFDATYDSRPRWSPDGSKLLFTRGGQLYTVNADGSGLAQLQLGAGSNTNADWGVRAADTTAPTVTITNPVDGGRYIMGDIVRALYSCSDAGGSGLVSCTGDVANNAWLDTSHYGWSTFTVTARDGAGNVTTKSVRFFLADLAPPGIDIVSPAVGGQYLIGSLVQVSFRCTDQPYGSGVASCTSTLPPGDRADTSTVGRKTFTVFATDGAGNRSSRDGYYDVVWPFAGFFSPLDADVNNVRAGDTLPLRFSLSGYRGLDVVQPGWPQFSTVPCDGSVQLDGGQPAGGSLEYNAKLDRYTWSWPSPKSLAGSCAQVVLELRDGTLHRATLRFGK